jgi:lysophospholipase L1-like esterase
MKRLLILMLVVGSSGAFSQRLDTLPNLPDHYKSRLAKFKSEPVVTGKIMFVGNSITEGGNWRRLLKDSSVINRGISGDNSFGLRQRLDEIVRHKPSKLFLLIGVNDLSKNIPNERTIENIFSFVSAMKSASPKTEIFVQSILPVNPSVKNFPTQFNKQENIREINGQLQKYAGVLKFTFVDINSHFSGGGDLLDAKFTYDGLHLNAAGYLHWVEFLKKNGYL